MLGKILVTKAGINNKKHIKKYYFNALSVGFFLQVFICD
ncbi:hypothetical protein C4K02_3127 [Pseudomonas synxantha]|nr:hypothetical protein C4K02_3127 [Pseudomonas synxantha]